MKKQSFIIGAAILMAANAISKILGAVFKIPLTYILHEEGMAVFGTAFQIYIMFLTFIISGFPLAVSKNVSEALSRSDYARAYSVVTVSTLILCVIGALGSVILYFKADFFALALKEEKAVSAIKMIAPSVFLVALGTGYKSYYQGTSDMRPTAAAQVIEAVIKLAAGYMLAAAFIGYGTEKTAGGAIFGVTTGEFAATAMLMSMYMYDKRRTPAAGRIRKRELLSDILSVALPILAAAVISNAMSVIDTTVTRTRLLDAGLSPDRARFLYGAYTGYAMTVFHLPSGIMATLGISILPVISGALAIGNTSRAQNAALSGIRLTLYMSIPFAVAMYTLPEEILSFLFGNTASAYMLQLSAPCIVMVCLSQIAASVMQAAGAITRTVVFSFIGSAVRLALDWTLIGKSEFNIYGSVISLNISYFIVTVLNLAGTSSALNIGYDIGDFLIKPAVCAAAMYAVIRFLCAPVTVRGNAGLIFTCAVSSAVYVLALIATGAVKLSDFGIKKTASV